jgi:hypothetical protein
LKKSQNFKYFGISLNKKGVNSEDIVNEIYKEEKNWLPELIMEG